jgi:hypothetical protein
MEALTGYSESNSSLRVRLPSLPIEQKDTTLQKLDPRACIGDLVGYDSSNIYRIWIPIREKVIRT